MNYPEKISLDGVTDKCGFVRYIGDATYSHGDGFYRCLAQVGEALCIVEVRIRRHEHEVNSAIEFLGTPQARVSAWVHSTFGESFVTDVPERALRATEEVLELAQACGLDSTTLHRLVDYVFRRPVGEAGQEIGGCMVTLYAAATALGIDADTALETELARIQRPEVVERCRRRQEEKRAALVAAR